MVSPGACQPCRETEVSGLTPVQCRRNAGLWDDVASLRDSVDRLKNQLQDAEAANRASAAYVDSRVDTGQESIRKGVRHAMKEVIQRVAAQLDKLAGDTHVQLTALKAEQLATRKFAEQCAAQVHVLSEAVSAKDAQMVRCLLAQAQVC